MDKYREINRVRILALILLVLLLPGCAPKPKPTAVPPTTAPVNEPADAPIAQIDATATSAPVEEAASPTPEAAQATNPTETPAPTSTPSVPTPTATLVVLNTAAPAPAQAGEVYEPIPGCAKSKLHWGDVIRVAPEKEYVRIRSTSDTHPSDNIIRKLYRSELAKTTGLPVCNYGWIVWPIQTADGTRGWVPESNGTDFWFSVYYAWAFPTSTPVSR